MVTGRSKSGEVGDLRLGVVKGDLYLRIHNRSAAISLIMGGNLCRMNQNTYVEMVAGDWGFSPAASLQKTMLFVWKCCIAENVLKNMQIDREYVLPKVFHCCIISNFEFVLIYHLAGFLQRFMIVSVVPVYACVEKTFLAMGGQVVTFGTVGSIITPCRESTAWYR
jgi:hypothetical protein